MIRPIREAFADHVSSAAFQVVDGELRVVGKFAQISIAGDKYDVWVVGRDKPMTQRKIRSITSKFPTGTGFQELTGEAYAQVAGLKFILQNLDLMGIRKKRQVTAETRARLANQLQEVRP